MNKLQEIVKQAEAHSISLEGAQAKLENLDADGVAVDQAFQQSDIYMKFNKRFRVRAEAPGTPMPSESIRRCLVAAFQHTLCTNNSCVQRARLSTSVVFAVIFSNPPQGKLLTKYGRACGCLHRFARLFASFQNDSRRTVVRAVQRCR